MNAALPGAIRLGKASQLSQLIHGCEAAGEGFRTPLFRAVLAGNLDVALITDPAGISMARIKRFSRPVAVLLCGDGHAPSPEQWSGLTPLLRWARAGVIHAAAGSPEHYAAAVEGAMISGRLVLVETGTAHIEAWAKRLEAAKVRTLLVRPAAGLPHPVPVPPERWQ